VDAASPTVEILRELVAIDSTSRRANTPLADAVCNRLDRPGVAIERHATADGAKVNLLIRIGPAGPPGGGLVLCGHTDTVPADEPAWTSDPFRLTDGGDRWVARGACDMKGFLALAVALAGELAPQRLAAPLVLLLTHDEEVGCLGAQRFAATAGREAMLPRAVVIGEPTGLAVVRMHKGHLRLRLLLHGRAAHSGFPNRGRSAIFAAGHALAALDELAAQLAAERPAGHHHFPEVPYVTLNAGTVHGGTAVNVVPELCAVELGLRPLPGMAAPQLVERVRSALEAALPAGNWELEQVNLSPPLLTPDTAPLHRDLCRLTGQRGDRATSFASDGGVLSGLGLDCVLFGPGAIEVAHRPDEFVPKAELARAGELLADLAARYCREEAG